MSRPDTVNSYNVGDLIRLHASVAASGGQMTTPSQMTLYLVSPSGGATYTYTGGGSIALAGAGAFYKDITAGYIGTIPISGLWRYAWQATGLVQAAEEWEFIVESKIWT